MSDLTEQATSDYLKVIYEICMREGRASTGEIADSSAGLKECGEIEWRAGMACKVMYGNIT